ncbi:MAG: DUF3014 domain-containing protein [Gammaproteobacteria bacterium]|nr:DUF3014 domain-containing protein [Gammaproteobacteria bacterium]
MKKKLVLPLIVLIAAAIVVLSYLNLTQQKEGTLANFASPFESESSEETADGEKHDTDSMLSTPVESKPVQTESSAAFSINIPVPPLANSDKSILKILKQFLDERSLALRFFRDNMVNRFVASIDNMTRSHLAQKTMFMKPPLGQFLPLQDGKEGLIISPRNARRYETMLRFAEEVPLDKLVTVYVHFYPLFQQAYENLGYPDRSFNTRFIQVIDHLLDAPEINQPLKLACPQVLCIYADPELEALSAGQRLMLRTGYDNVLREKELLRRLKKEIKKRMH